ncbi:MAG TPA: PRC-barrel domain-containing protein [Longimicrobiales bacterium]|nr:PRC-barrel domain-containing protein [Longimicrobiales bacterium]
MNDDAHDRIPLRAVPDLRGLAAEDASGLHVGELWGALAEADTGLIRYLDLQLARRPRHVLVPIGHARIRDGGPATRVRLRAALLEELESIPPYDSDAGEISDPYERALLEAHGRAYHGERYYAHPSFDHGGLFAGEHPIVAAGGNVTAAEPLQLLGALPDYRVAAGEPDIRGWSVRGAGDALLGLVHDLVVDTAARKVRYLVIDADHGTARQVVLPVGYVHVDAAAERVSAPALDGDDLAGLPGWTGGALERTDEEAVRAALQARLTGHRRYQAPDFALPWGGTSALEERRA